MCSVWWFSEALMLQRSCSSPCVFNAGLSTVSPYRQHSCDTIAKNHLKMDVVKRFKMLMFCLEANKDVWKFRMWTWNRNRHAVWWSEVILWKRWLPASSFDKIVLSLYGLNIFGKEGIFFEKFTQHISKNLYLSVNIKSKNYLKHLI